MKLGNGAVGIHSRLVSRKQIVYSKKWLVHCIKYSIKVQCEKN